MWKAPLTVNCAVLRGALSLGDSIPGFVLAWLLLLQLRVFLKSEMHSCTSRSAHEREKVNFDHDRIGRVVARHFLTHQQTSTAPTFRLPRPLAGRQLAWLGAGTRKTRAVGKLTTRWSWRTDETRSVGDNSYRWQDSFAINKSNTVIVTNSLL